MRVRITTFGCREWLQHTGRINVGELELIDVTPRPKTIHDVQKRVCDFYGLPIRVMSSARRARDEARPRQVSMYLCKQLTPKSLPQIGHYHGGRDHTTVIHAVRRIEELRASDAELANEVDYLLEELAA